MKKHLSTDSKVFPFLSLIVLAVIWGSSFILMKRGLEAYSPIQVGALRVVLSAFVLLPVAWKHYLLYLKKYWKHFLFFACMTNLLPAILFAQAQSQISSSLAGILNSMTPIFTFAIGILLFSSPFKVNQALGLILGIAGSVMLILFGGNGLGDINYYAFFVVLATMFYGLGNNFLRKNFMDIPPVALTAVSFMTVLPVALIILLFSGFIGTATTHPLALQSLGYIVILAIVGTAMSLILFNKLIQTTSAVFASTVTYLIPIVAVGWGLLDGETISIMHIGGLVLIISGIWFVSKN
ncbi:DMT family transporter [Ignavibacteriales bacterium]